MVKKKRKVHAIPAGSIIIFPGTQAAWLNNIAVIYTDIVEITSKSCKGDVKELDIVSNSATGRDAHGSFCTFH